MFRPRGMSVIWFGRRQARISSGASIATRDRSDQPWVVMTKIDGVSATVLKRSAERFLIASCWTARPASTYHRHGCALVCARLRKTLQASSNSRSVCLSIRILILIKRSSLKSARATRDRCSGYTNTGWQNKSDSFYKIISHATVASCTHIHTFKLHPIPLPGSLA